MYKLKNDIDSQYLKKLNFRNDVILGRYCLFATPKDKSSTLLAIVYNDGRVWIKEEYEEKLLEELKDLLDR